MPARVRSFVQLGRFHNIEVEDNVTAYMEFSNGGTGTFTSTTGEAPGTNRLELAGEMGKLLLENDSLTFYRNEVSVFQHSKTSRLGFQKPEAWKIEIPISSEPAQHAVLTQNFVDAILDGVPLIAPGEEGINSIELANVLLYSGLMNETIELPLDSAAYEKKLNELIAASKFEKKVAAVSSEDFTKSFRR